MQDTDGVIVELSEYLRDFGLTHNPQAIRRLPDRLNTLDTAQTCKWCRTAFRTSDQRDTARCPFCWRLI